MNEKKEVVKKEVVKSDSKPIVKNSEVKSDNKADKMKDKVLRTVVLRNRFFFILYRYSTLVFLTSLCSFLFSIIFLIFFIKQPVPPQYIPLKSDGTYINLDPLDKEKPSAEVEKFAITAIKKLYKYDYINFSEQIQDASSYFTEEGWNNYLDEYVKSDTLTAVKENKWIVTVKPLTVPIIVKKGLIDGVFVWEIQSTIEVMYVGTTGQIQRGDLYMRITRESVINNPDGLGIVLAVFKPKT